MIWNHQTSGLKGQSYDWLLIIEVSILFFFLFSHMYQQQKVLNISTQSQNRGQVYET